MNKQEADQIVEAGLNHRIGCKVLNKAEVYEIIMDDQARFRSFEAAKYGMKAFIIEKQHSLYENPDFELPDIFLEHVENEKGNASTEGTKEKGPVSLKISNKETLFDFSTFLVFTTHQNVCKVQNLKYSTVPQIIADCELEPGEKPIYICGTKYYKGYLIVAFDNGKIGKITMESFKTEFNRKKLKSAFNGEADLVFIEQIDQDMDLIAVSDIDKIVLFNTNQINPVGSRTTKGVQVMKSKDRSLMVKVKKLSQVNLSDPEYYRKSGGLNVVGFYLKEGDEI